MIRDWAVDLSLQTIARRLATLLAGQLVQGERRERVLVECELYLASARSQELRPLSLRWDGVLRTALEESVGRTADQVYFATYNGLALEAVVSGESVDEAEAERLFSAIHID